MERAEKERRKINIDLRTSDDESKMILEGYPIVFEQETLIGDEERGFIEVIDRHAFDEADMSDVCLRYNHSDNFLILARTRNNSLSFYNDEHGVFMHSELIDTTTNTDVYKMARSGLLSQGSFAFTVKDQEITRRDGMIVRRIKKVGKCFDFSVVDTPAYDGTAIYARSLEMCDIWKETVETAQSEKRDYKIANLIKQYKGVKQ